MFGGLIAVDVKWKKFFPREERVSVHIEEERIFQVIVQVWDKRDCCSVQNESCPRTTGNLSLIFLSTDFINIAQAYAFYAVY